MSVPRDFLAEVEAELDAARSRLRRSADEWSSLEELRDRALAASRRLRRPVSVFDIVRLAEDDDDRARVTSLVRILRQGPRD